MFKSKAEKFFSDSEKKNLLNAIIEAENNTSGEVRIHIDSYCKVDVLDRAAYIFNKLGMKKTNLRNGVLFYLAVKSKKFAIIGDSGINAVVPENFWNEVKEILSEYFSNGNFSEGLCKGIEMAGEHLKKYFPHQSDDVNELSNDISFSKN
jgi:uncharacterized membrane protein